MLLGPNLTASHFLTLADWALSGEIADMTGFIPPPDYIDSALPYIRYSTTLRDIHRLGDAMPAVESGADAPDMERHASRLLVPSP